MRNSKKVNDVLKFQQQEITEYEIYKRLSKRFEGKNREILEKIAADEKKHYEIMKKITGVEVPYKKLYVFFYMFLTWLFGMVFALKAMERGEKIVQDSYLELADEYPEIKDVIEDEEKHELMLINMLQEERIGYVSSMVLGLNDAIVELTGTLAGLTFALRNSKVVGLAGIITGISAALSMAASEYLSQKSEKDSSKSPLKAAIYTGIAYILVVFILVLPYFLFGNPLVSLGAAVSMVVVVIGLFTYFVAVIKDQSYKTLFFEMMIISFSVMIVSFLIGIVAKKILGIEL